MINEVKLNKLLNKMGTVCNPISALRPDSVDELAKKYKKKDYEQLIHLAFNMYSCIQEANTAIRDVLNQSLQNDGSKGTVLIIEEIKRNRAEIIELKHELSDQTKSVLEETANFKSYADAAWNKVSVKPNQFEAKKVVKTIVSEIKKQDRKKNLILYGLEENDNDKDQQIKEALDDIGFSGLNFELEPIGECKQGNSRPLRMRLSSEATVSNILRNAHRLKTGASWLYLAPDRSYKERRARSDLVKKLREKIIEDPSTKWSIRSEEIVDNGKM